MKVYVASSFQNREEVSRLIASLRSEQFEITHDWTNKQPWRWEDREEVNQRAPGVAVEDLQGVLDADVFVMLTYTEVPMVGAYVELGAALASGKQVVIAGDQGRNVFQWHPNVLRLSTQTYIIPVLRMLRRRMTIEEVRQAENARAI